MPPADIPVELPVPEEPITIPEEPQIAISDEEEVPSEISMDESEKEKLTWREKHEGMEMEVPVPDMDTDVPSRSPTETIPVERTEVERISSEKTPVDVTPVQRIPVEVTPVEKTPVERIPVQKTPVERIQIERTPVQKIPVDHSQPERTSFEKPEYEDAEKPEPQFEEEPVRETEDELSEIEFVPGEEVIEILSEQFDIVLKEVEIFEMTKEDIETIVSDTTGVPIVSIDNNTAKFFTRLNRNLKREIIGQNETVKIICSALKVSQAHLNDPTQPVGTFLFLGSTGVGKTYMCKLLAKYLFGGEQR